MSNVDESSYYEIALTNRQVMSAFVILLVCVLAAFFGGVWVGRGQPTLAEQPGQVEGPVELAALAEEREKPREFEFFSREGESPTPTPRPDLARIAAEPNPETTLAQDLGVEPIVEPEVTDSSEATQEGQTVVQAPVKPPGRAQPVTEKPAAEETGPYVIQVFSSHDEIQARRLLTRLQAGGFETILSPVEVASGTMYRVRIGPFEQRHQAESVAARARREHKVDTWITSPE